MHYDHTVKVMNNFQGLDLVDRVPKELWTEVCNAVREAMTKTIPRAKWLSEEALQIAEERGEMKGKGERERHTQQNAEFQRIAREMEKALAPHSSTPPWKIPWTEEPGGLQSMGSHRVGHD